MLVVGESDRVAVQTLVRRRGRELVEAQGQLRSFLTYQKQPARRAWPLDGVLDHVDPRRRRHPATSAPSGNAV